MSATKRPRSYAGLLLLMYVLSSGAAARVAAEAQTPGEKLGAYAVPFAFLAFGVYAAFRNGGRVARTFASLLVGVLLASLAVGLYGGYQQHRVPSEVQGELRELQAGLGLDLSSDQAGPELARRRSELTNDAARRLQASEDPKAVEYGRAIQLVSELSSESEARFIAAVEDLDVERILCVGEMVAEREFDWRREVLEEYAAAARAGLYNVDSLPERAQAMAVRERLPAELAKGILAGINDTRPTAMEVWRSHERVAKAYLEMVDLVERNIDGITVYEDGTYEFDDPESMQAFEQSTERAIAAEEALEAGVERLRKAQQG